MEKELYCEKCDNKHWVYMFDAGLDGHGGMNGGGYDWFPCGACNNPIIYRRSIF